MQGEERRKRVGRCFSSPNITKGYTLIVIPPLPRLRRSSRFRSARGPRLPRGSGDRPEEAVGVAPVLGDPHAAGEHLRFPFAVSMLRLRLANRVRQAPGRRREVVERSEEAGVRHETPGEYPPVTGRWREK